MFGVDLSIDLYDHLIKNIINQNQNADIYIQSMTPLSPEMEKQRNVKNIEIIQFNEKLEQLAQKYGCTYIDLYSVYQLNGYMNDEYSTDGLHIKTEYYYLWADAIEQFIYE